MQINGSFGYNFVHCGASCILGWVFYYVQVLSETFRLEEVRVGWSTASLHGCFMIQCRRSHLLAPFFRLSSLQIYLDNVNPNICFCILICLLLAETIKWQRPWHQGTDKSKVLFNSWFINYYLWEDASNGENFTPRWGKMYSSMLRIF